MQEVPFSSGHYWQQKKKEEPHRMEMNENLLQFIWQFQYFNHSELKTAEGEELHVLHPGRLNREQGPDFRDARIRIGTTVFAGSVELHLKTSQWNDHGHEGDPAYGNVILHVVLHHNAAVNKLPVLELHSRISNLLLERYRMLMAGGHFIPCASSMPILETISWQAWKERLLAERLQRKSAFVFELLQQNGQHWEETFWWMLARNFGMTTNTDAFEAVARSVPMSILSRHRHQIQQLEALLLGQANLLEGTFTEAYPLLLEREYRFLKKKYGLQPVHHPLHFLRMRPSNFPSIRLAQLAALVQDSDRLFSRLLETGDLEAVKKFFAVQANDYWHYHYRLEEPSEFREKKTGSTLIDSLVINTVIPVLFAYGSFHKKQEYKDRAIGWMQQLPPENHAITRGFMELKVGNASAFDSQALVELKTHYCDARRCLACTVGNSILKMI